MGGGLENVPRLCPLSGAINNAPVACKLVDRITGDLRGIRAKWGGIPSAQRQKGERERERIIDLEKSLTLIGSPIIDVR